MVNSHDSTAQFERLAAQIEIICNSKTLIELNK